MVSINKLLRLKVATNQLIAKKINTANNFIFPGESLLPKRLSEVEERIVEKIDRLNDPILRILDRDSYERFHNLNYRS